MEPIKRNTLYVSTSPVALPLKRSEEPATEMASSSFSQQLPAITIRRVLPPKSPVNLLKASGGRPRPRNGDIRSKSMDAGLDELRRRSGRPAPVHRQKVDEIVLVQKFRSSMDRKSRFVEVDNEAMRKLADERAQNAQKAAVEKARKASEEALRKRQEVIQQRTREAEAKEQRRAEIYALNAVMNEISRRNFIRAANEKQDPVEDLEDGAFGGAEALEERGVADEEPAATTETDEVDKEDTAKEQPQTERSVRRRRMGDMPPDIDGS